MNIINIADFRKDQPAKITFFGPKYINLDGNESSITVTVEVQNGDVLGVLDAVREQGGITALKDEKYFFLPWPCAAVEIYDI